MQISTLGTDTQLWRAIVQGQARTTSARPEGLHLSTILNDLALTVWPKDFAYLNREPGGEHDDRTLALFEAGNVLEDVMAQVLMQRAGWTKPVPRLCDGIWCSPDGVAQASRTLDEVKATWKSSRDFRSTPKFQVYTYQVLAYMHVYDVARARLHVFHVNGDWRPPRPEPPTTYILKPSAAEVTSNWRMICQHAYDRGWLRGTGIKGKGTGKG